MIITFTCDMCSGVRAVRRRLFAFAVRIPDRNPVIVHVSLATEPRRLLKALRSNGVSTIEVDVVVFDGNLAEWARGRMEWTIRQRRSAEWPVNSP
jgi:hypothetical protein